MRQALVLWFTGLSGSGKTTIAKIVSDTLKLSDKRVKVYDGDVVRKRINKHLNFSPRHILENNKIIAELCLKNIGRYDYIFVPVISPFEQSRTLAKEIIGNPLHLIYVKASLKEVMKRDVKGLYRKALRGDIKNFIGIDDDVPYVPPKDADLILDTEKENPGISAKRLLKYIRSNKNKARGLS